MFTFSIKSIFVSLRDAAKYPNMFRFLICWFLYSDGFTTMSLSAVLFAVSELNMTSGETAILLVEVKMLSLSLCELSRCDMYQMVETRKLQIENIVLCRL